MWKSDGVFPFPLPYTNESILVPFSFLECCQAFPPYPMYSCRAALIHGKDDDVVLLKNIEDFFEKVSVKRMAARDLTSSYFSAQSKKN